MDDAHPGRALPPFSLYGRHKLGAAAAAALSINLDYLALSELHFIGASLTRKTRGGS